MATTAQDTTVALSNDLVFGTGDASAFATAEGTATALSLVDISFTTSSPLLFTFEGDIYGSATAELIGANFQRKLGDSFTSHSGMLNPGSYELIAIADLTSTDNVSEAGYDFSFAVFVPESTTMSGLLVIALLAFTRQRTSEG